MSAKIGEGERGGCRQRGDGAVSNPRDRGSESERGGGPGQAGTLFD